MAGLHTGRREALKDGLHKSRGSRGTQDGGSSLAGMDAAWPTPAPYWFQALSPHRKGYENRLSAATRHAVAKSGCEPSLFGCQGQGDFPVSHLVVLCFSLCAAFLSLKRLHLIRTQSTLGTVVGTGTSWAHLADAETKAQKVKPWV